MDRVMAVAIYICVEVEKALLRRFHIRQGF